MATFPKPLDELQRQAAIFRKMAKLVDNQLLAERLERFAVQIENSAPAPSWSRVMVNDGTEEVSLRKAAG